MHFSLKSCFWDPLSEEITPPLLPLWPHPLWLAWPIGNSLIIYPHASAPPLYQLISKAKHFSTGNLYWVVIIVTCTYPSPFFAKNAFYDMFHRQIFFWYVVFFKSLFPRICENVEVFGAESSDARDTISKLDLESECLFLSQDIG